MFNRLLDFWQTFVSSYQEQHNLIQALVYFFSSFDSTIFVSSIFFATDAICFHWFLHEAKSDKVTYNGAYYNTYDNLIAFEFIALSSLNCNPKNLTETSFLEGFLADYLMRINISLIALKMS